MHKSFVVVVGLLNFSKLKSIVVCHTKEQKKEQKSRNGATPPPFQCKDRSLLKHVAFNFSFIIIIIL